MKKVLIVLFLFLAFLLVSNPAFADETSSVSHDVVYVVTEDGLTHVSFISKITNLVANMYTSSYSIDTGFKDIKNIKSSDGIGNLVSEVSDSENGKNIKLDFNQKVVGVGSVLNFKLSFDTKEVARKLGSIWEINIPGLSKKGDFSNFDVHVRVPVSFGKAAYIKPERPLDNLNFTKDDLVKSGISISIGENQIYKFYLTYHLKNSNLFPVKTEIALPPSTNYQDVYIENIVPRPENVEIDKDGNWLAKFSLMPSESKEVNVAGKTKVFLYPKSKPEELNNLSQFTVEKPYWQVSDPQIQKLAKTLKTPEEIYKYVVNKLKYDFQRVTSGNIRVGALGVLNNPDSAVCLEFTDLFVAIARAAGIPAREVDGFAYAENSKQRPLSLVKDILHAWPEYYDKEKQTWIMIDPTWGNTTGGVDYFKTFDFDHFAFVIKGMDSEYPIPAGGYKIPGSENTKDIRVSFSQDFESKPSTIQINADFPDKIISGFPINGSITLKNAGQNVLQRQDLTIISDSLNPKLKDLTINEIPPFGYIKIPVSFEKESIFTRRKSIIEFSINGKKMYNVIEINPFFISEWKVIGGIFFAVFTIGIFIFAARARGLYFFRQRE